MKELKLLIEEELRKVFQEDRNAGQVYVDVISGDIHKRLGFVNRHPAVCNGMRAMMKTGDVILEKPPKGNGAKLKIRYYL